MVDLDGKTGQGQTLDAYLNQQVSIRGKQTCRTPAALFYTGGTTGESVMVSYGALTVQTLNLLTISMSRERFVMLCAVPFSGCRWPCLFVYRRDQFSPLIYHRIF